MSSIPTVGIHDVRDQGFSIVPYASKNAASHMERRAYRRVPAPLQGFLLGNSHEVETITLDLSMGGARFDCDLEVCPGKVIRVRLVIPSVEEPILIADARVQWVGEDAFGVSFQNVLPIKLDELEQFIEEYEESEDSGHA